MAQIMLLLDQQELTTQVVEAVVVGITQVMAMAAQVALE